MIIEKIPNFLLSPSDIWDSFIFDKSGRFIFCKKSNYYKDDKIFIIYDILFNTYVELTPNSPNPNIALDYLEYHSFWPQMGFFLPISVEQGLVIVRSGSTSVVLLLVHFNLHKKIYEILDNIKILKCQHPEFVQDGDIFGLYYLSTIDGEVVEIMEQDNAFLTLKKFTIEENRIKCGEEKKFNFNPFNEFDFPVDPYLRSNKLWYIRKKPKEVFVALPPQHRHLHRNILPPDPTEDNLFVCYFDLNEDIPAETFVYEIQVEKSDTIPILRWVQNSLLFLQFGTKFDALNLSTFQWSSKALNSGYDFTNVDENGKWKENRTWIEYQYSKSSTADWANFSAIHIDDEYVITAVNQNTSTLHRIPLKEPLKLSMLAWSCALNAGLINGNPNLPPKLPYSRIF